MNVYLSVCLSVCRVEEFNILDMQFLHGYDEPTLLLLYHVRCKSLTHSLFHSFVSVCYDNGARPLCVMIGVRCRTRRKVSPPGTYRVGVSEKQLYPGPWNFVNIDRSASLLLPVPLPIGMCPLPRASIAHSMLTPLLVMCVCVCMYVFVYVFLCVCCVYVVCLCVYVCVGGVVVVAESTVSYYVGAGVPHVTMTPTLIRAYVFCCCSCVCVAIIRLRPAPFSVSCGGYRLRSLSFCVVDVLICVCVSVCPLVGTVAWMPTARAGCWATIRAICLLSLCLSSRAPSQTCASTSWARYGLVSVSVCPLQRG